MSAFACNRRRFVKACGAVTACAAASADQLARRAFMLAGPAKFPLAAVLLDHDAATDELTATGFVGTALFEEFFAAFRANFDAEFGSGAYRNLMQGRTTVVPLNEYSESILRC